MKRFVIGHRHVACAAAILEPGVLRTDAGVIETGRDGMGFADLPVGILQHIRAVAVQHAHASCGERRGVMPGGNALACRFNAHQAGIRQGNVGVENAHGV